MTYGIDDLAYVAVISEEGYGLGVAVRDQAGYHPLREPLTFETYDEANTAARTMNERLGLSPREADEIIASSMRRAD